MKRIRRPDGFTLVEALVALVLFSALLVALPALLLTTFRANVDAGDLSAATSIGEAKVEELKALPLSALVSGGPEAVTKAGRVGGSGAIYQRSWTVSDNTPMNDAKRVTVNVSWSSHGGRALTFDTIFTP
jgi:prepilin-type N-terminal cleavage/methylation domain-containing protein